MLDVLSGIDGGPADHFGESIGLKGSQLIISGAYTGGPSVFEFDSTGNHWLPVTRLTAPVGSQRFGNSVDISEPWAVVGDYYADKVHFFAVARDCNANGKADVCDIKDGISTDLDGDQRPDSCPCPFTRPTYEAGPKPQPPLGCDAPGCAPKNRYLTFIPPQTPSGSSGIALRVTLEIPGPYTCGHVPDFSAVDGEQMWVGPEHIEGATPSGVHRLQPSPYFYDWSLLDDFVLNVSDCNIVPCAAYLIEAISDADYPIGPYSPGLTLTTAPVWGDVVATGSGTLPNGIVDFADISALVDRFRNIPSASPKPWCDIASINPTQGGNFNIDFGDIAAVVDAFRGKDYPFPAPTAPQACP